MSNIRPARAAALALLLVLGGSRAWAAAGAESPGDGLSISLITFEPGAIYWERFGHNAILVRDRFRGTEIAYNYGIFDFEEADFLLNFARGRMQYQMAARDFGDDVAFYASEGRGIVEQQLNLAPLRRQQLQAFLQWNAQPENTRYPYDYFTSNCSTRVRDALNRALDGELRRQLEARPGGATYRFDAVRLVAPDLALALGMDLALGPAADRPLDLWQRSFVPMVLEQALQRVTVTAADGSLQPLVTASVRWQESRVGAVPVQPPPLLAPFAALGAAGATLMLLLARRATRIAWSASAVSLLAVYGCAGVILASIWGLTVHWAGWRNENLLLLDPLCLLLLPAAIARGRQKSKWDRGNDRRDRSRLAVAVAGLGCIAPLLRLLPGAQQNLPWILLLLPPLLAVCAPLIPRRPSAVAAQT